MVYIKCQRVKHGLNFKGDKKIWQVFQVVKKWIFIFQMKKKASEILNQLGNELWKDDCDDEAFFFTDLGNGIENALKGQYFIP